MEQFSTGILGFEVFARIGAKRGVTRDWSVLSNDLRRRYVKMMLKLGQHEPPSINCDGAHRIAMKELVGEHYLDAFSEPDMEAIVHDAPHQIKCWPDFPPVLAKLRRYRTVASSKVLSDRLVMDTAKVHGLSWDTAFSCEGIGKYKTLSECLT